MPTIWEIAEQLTALYWTLYERGDSTLEAALDALFDAVADLDGGLCAVRRLRH